MKIGIALIIIGIALILTSDFGMTLTGADKVVVSEYPVSVPLHMEHGEGAWELESQDCENIAVQYKYWLLGIFDEFKQVTPDALWGISETIPSIPFDIQDDFGEIATRSQDFNALISLPENFTTFDGDVEFRARFFCVDNQLPMDRFQSLTFSAYVQSDGVCQPPDTLPCEGAVWQSVPSCSWNTDFCADVDSDICGTIDAPTLCEDKLRKKAEIRLGLGLFFVVVGGLMVLKKKK